MSKQSRERFSEVEQERTAKMRALYLHGGLSLDTGVLTLADLCKNEWALLEDGTMCDAFILSVDVRYSTSIMHLSDGFQDFIVFMRDLCIRLKSVVDQNYGIHYQYTGDGILAIFPLFYSGSDAGFYVLQSACQSVEEVKDPIADIKRKLSGQFPSGIGIGIGIGFGAIHVVEIMNEVVIMGEELVNACRLSGCDAETTMITTKAFENIGETGRLFAEFKETEIPIKKGHEMIGYQVTHFNQMVSCSPPCWRDISVP